MKKIINLLILSFVLNLPNSSEAQNVGIGTTAPVARLHVTDSNVIFSAPTVLVDPASFTTPLNGPGTRLMWLPKKSAFRVGTVTNNQWNSDSIGAWSVATGINTKATDFSSTALGNSTIASSHSSTAMGFSSVASGISSTATGYFTIASGGVSTAMGNYTIAAGVNSTAMGLASSANGYTSLAIGSSATANGDYSSSIGNVTAAQGYISTAFGNFTKASGSFSTATGNYTNAKAYASLSTGQYNDSISSSSNTNWVPSDPLFYIGNGTSDTTRHNAMVIYKNGNMVLKNPTTVTDAPVGFTVPVSGPGTRMMWLPEKSAFRAGTVDNNNWNADSIGLWSIAIGYNTKAKGDISTAMGAITNASGDNSTAMGNNTTASGSLSTAMGNFTIASGSLSTAMGNNTIASGNSSTAMGNNNIASAGSSTAMGGGTIASGNYSTTMGFTTIAKSYFSLAIGQYNDSIAGSNPTAFVSTDPLFYVGNGTANNARHNAMVIYKNGNMVLKNPTTVTTEPVGFTVPVSGPGTRMMWLPEKSAFRAGTVSNNNWNADSIGTWSFASGYSTEAKNSFSTALGLATAASGYASTSMGNITTASGSASTAMGYFTTASGDYSTTIGNGAIASGNSSAAIGNGAKATGSFSTAMGFSTKASGSPSTAMGNTTTATGNSSTAMGFFTTATGDISTAMGSETIAKSYTSLAMGSLNDTLTGTSAATWVNTDPLVYIGNGNPSGTARSNALVVYKNADVDINGYTRLGKLSEGAPTIKTKKITGTGPAVNGSIPIVHGLNASKILSVSVLMEFGSGPAETIPPFYTISAGYEYQYQVRTADIFITNKNGNSANIAGKPVKILITYEE